jgi:uncharacterized membrane protein
LDPKFLANVLTKWIHLSSAAFVVGGAVYLRFVLYPALGKTEATRELWVSLSRKTYRWMDVALTLLLLTGLDNIMKARKTLGGLTPEQLSAYWTVFWAKIVLFVAAFVFVHLLLIRVPAFRSIQEKPRPWISALTGIVLLILALSGYLALTRATMLPQL